MYIEKDLVEIAKRENNNKRKYLVVNRLQGKHIPVSPSKAFTMFDELAELVGNCYEDERLLLVGFAETATAIGSALAIKLNTYYMQTTRENIEGVEYLYFSESHSHATEQKLVKTDLDLVVDKIDRIVFVEDEVTTGNTILNIIRIIEEVYNANLNKKLQFSVASLLNGMNEEAEAIYRNRNIPIHFLVKTNHDAYTKIAEQYQEDGVYYPVNVQEKNMQKNSVQDNNIIVSKHVVAGCKNARRLIDAAEYELACKKLFEAIMEDDEIQIQNADNAKRILVIGTEEFMYPAMYVAKKLEEQGNFVNCHSTTRSPIAISSAEEYPLHERYELRSMYDKDRVTFLYDIAKYDEVFIITDAKCLETEGVNSLIYAVCLAGNDKIHLIQWKDFL